VMLSISFVRLSLIILLCIVLGFFFFAFSCNLPYVLVLVFVSLRNHMGCLKSFCYVDRKET
jgi:hypothetical protein